MTHTHTKTWEAVAFDNAPQGIATLDSHGQFVAANQACALVFGVEPDVLKGTVWADLVLPSYRTLVGHELAEAQKAPGIPRDVTASHMHSAGRMLVLKIRITAHASPTTDGVSTLLHIIDQSEAFVLRELERGRSRAITLMETDAPLDAVIQALLDAVEQAAPNLAAVAILREDGATRAVATASFPHARFRLNVQRAVDGQSAQWVTLRQNGSVAATLAFTPWLAASTESAPALLVTVLTDSLNGVLNWHSARAGESESNRRFATMMRNLPGMAYRCANEADWPMSWVSAGSVRITGHPPEFFTGDNPTPFADLIHVDDQERVWAQVQQAVAAHEPFLVQYRIQDADGDERMLWEQGEGIFENGEMVALEGLIIDTTPIHAVQTALRRSEEQLQSLLDSIDEAVVATDDAGLITHFNPCAEVLVGIPHGAAIGCPVDDVVHLTKVPDGAAVSLTGLRAAQDNFRLVAQNREPREVICSTSPLRDQHANVRGHVVVIRDVTERLETQRQLHHVQRMDAVGELAGGVAHDFNNLLTGMMGYADLLRSELRGQPALAEYAETILQTSRRAADLTSQLLTFARREPKTLVRLNAHEVIEEALELLRRTVGPQITLEASLRAPYVTISADRTLLQNVLINLGINARDAIGDSGTIRFATRLVNLDSWATSLRGRQLASFELEPGIHLQITVSDTGPGIPESLLHRVFEPFFTTKEAGKGTGLGLASAYGTIKGHHGGLVASNAPDGGAVFSIYLPIEEPGMEATNSSEQSVIRGDGTILLVEDEEVVRRILEKMLVNLGYDVVTAPDGETGYEAFEACEDGFSLVIMDLMLPGLSGAEVLTRMIAKDADVKVLVASGKDVGE
ncbi:MAG: PAS domain S-box-containing protein, partial [Myxococcota bacterium]